MDAKADDYVNRNCTTDGQNKREREREKEVNERVFALGYPLVRD